MTQVLAAKHLSQEQPSNPNLAGDYKQTEVGLTPSAWEVTNLGALVALQRGHDLTERQRKKGDVVVMGSAGPNGYHNVALVRGPGLVLGRSGASFGQAHYCECDFWPHNTALYVIDFKGNSSKFCFYFLRNTDFSQHNSGGAQQSLNRNFISSIPIALPKRTEQDTIAEALSDADALIEGLESLIAKKRLIKQGAMQELLSARRRLPGFSGEWEVKPLGLLGAFAKGSGVKREDANSGNLPCVRYGELYTRHHDVIREYHSLISASVASTARRLKKGDILFAGSGETKEEIGKCASIVHGGEAYAGGDIIILRPTNDDPVFLGYYLNTPEVQMQKASRGQGDAVVHISATALGEITVRLPRPPEQAAIATVLSDMDEEIAALEQRLAKTRAIKQGMMQELLTGRIRLV